MSRHSPRRPNSPPRSDERRPRTASTKSGSAGTTRRADQTGTPSTSSGSRPASRCRRELAAARRWATGYRPSKGIFVNGRPASTASAAALDRREGRDLQSAELVQGFCEHLDFGPQLGRWHAGPLADIAAQAEVGASAADEQGPRAALGDLADGCAQVAAHLEADPIAARANETEDGQGPV